MITHHLADDLIVSYAAGALEEGWSLVVAAHLALCPLCTRRCATAEAVGGLLIEELEASQPLEQSWNAVRMRLEHVTRERSDRTGKALVRPDSLPEPVRTYVRGDVNSAKRSTLGRGLYRRIRTRDGKLRAWVLDVPAGMSVPEHGHRGRELAIVLSGSLFDGQATFRRGDILDADEGLTHRPVAGQEANCVCLVVTDAPLRFRNWAIRAVQPFLRI